MMTNQEEIIKILKNYTVPYKCLKAVPEDRIVIEDHFDEIAEHIAKIISSKPMLAVNGCDHIRESDGMKCTGGRCSKCNEIV